MSDSNLSEKLSRPVTLPLEQIDEHKEGDEAEEFSTIGDGFSEKDVKGELHQREQANL